MTQPAEQPIEIQVDYADAFQHYDNQIAGLNRELAMAKASQVALQRMLQRQAAELDTLHREAASSPPQPAPTKRTVRPIAHNEPTNRTDGGGE